MIGINTLHTPIRRALISAYDKTGLITLSKALIELGFQMIATDGTAKFLLEHQFPVTSIEDYTGFPEIMSGRVKTLHPKVHGGLLAQRFKDVMDIRAYDIQPIDLLVVNLYPFTQTIQKSNCSLEEAIEQIDIGGATMLRAAAKNFHEVTVLIDPADYELVLNEMKCYQGATTFSTRKKLAIKVFAELSKYNQSIAEYLEHSDACFPNETASLFPKHYQPAYHKLMDLRYGENPHQAAALYEDIINQPQLEGIAQAQLQQGKPLSFNNIVDSDAALECVRDLDSTLFACVIVKHATPCGVSQSNSQCDAYLQAYATDMQSAFGGIIAFNSLLKAATVETILRQQFVEVLLAPNIEKTALRLLSSKPNIRVLIFSEKRPLDIKTYWKMHSLSDGLLLQEQDRKTVDSKDFNIVTKRQPTDAEREDLTFAWQVVKYVKSNAIVYAKNQRTLGIGSSTSRVFAAKIAKLKAEESGFLLNHAVMASDAFFPFTDGIEVAARTGIRAVIQPGGSKRDAEVIAAANRYGMTMVFTAFRHFRH